MCALKAKQKSWQGVLAGGRSHINLSLTLLGGQSFRWTKVESDKEQTSWSGVTHNAYWELTQNDHEINYTVVPAQDGEENHNLCKEYFRNILRSYLRLDFDMDTHMEKWKAAHRHFAETAQTINAVRVLDQQPLENILSFICSQNNHIRRISSMVEWLCSQYGLKIGTFHGKDHFTFPTLDALLKNQENLEERMRVAKFGYRAKFIAQTVRKIAASGGIDWLQNLRRLPYAEARDELLKLPGIGPKVADCICLMSLNHLEAVPVDTHIFKIAQSAYMPQLASVKSVTLRVYDDIGNHFRGIYGEYAGWAQAVLFCSGLQQFRRDSSDGRTVGREKIRKRKQSS